MDNSMPIKQYGLENYIDSLETFVNFLENFGISQSVLIELYEKLYFPQWYGYWKKQGIDQTRKTIEKVYKNLKTSNTSNLGNLIANISIALNTLHQSGKMLEYVMSDVNEYEVSINGGLSDDIDGFLERLTNGHFNHDWNKDLLQASV
jgi:hypothetical protein